VIDTNPDLLSSLDASQIKIFKDMAALDGETIEDRLSIAG
jgi:hypothetical protein